MKAILMDAHGGPDVLYLGEARKPVPSPTQILIRVMAVGVNPADYKWRRGMFASFAPLSFPHIPGYDVAGIVEESPAGAAPKGTHVAAMLNSLTQGAYAEYALVEADDIGLIPEGMRFEQAVAVPTPGLTGVQMAEEHMDAKPGQTLLITGATGAVGRFGLWAAKRRGAQVIAAVRAHHRDEAKALGADVVLTLGEEDWTGGAIDAVGDTVGGEIVEGLCRNVPASGRIFTAATDPIPAEHLATPVVFFGVHPNGPQLTSLLQGIAKGEISLPVAKTMKLADAAIAQAAVEAGGAGKIVLIP
jgi:NADPH:quinone reductase-like Zn-dependent oxidoreductase